MYMKRYSGWKCGDPVSRCFRKFPYKKNVIRDTEPKFTELILMLINTQKTTKNKHATSHVHQACRGDALIGDLHRGVKVDIFRGL